MPQYVMTRRCAAPSGGYRVRISAWIAVACLLLAVPVARGQGALLDGLRGGHEPDLQTELSAALQLPVAECGAHFRQLLDAAADDLLADVQFRNAFPA